MLFILKESDRLLRVELEACKQELEMERNRSRVLLNIYKEKGTSECFFQFVCGKYSQPRYQSNPAGPALQMLFYSLTPGGVKPVFSGFTGCESVQTQDGETRTE